MQCHSRRMQQVLYCDGGHGVTAVHVRLSRIRSPTSVAAVDMVAAVAADVAAGDVVAAVAADVATGDVVAAVAADVAAAVAADVAAAVAANVVAAVAANVVAAADAVVVVRRRRAAACLWRFPRKCACKLKLLRMSRQQMSQK